METKCCIFVDGENLRHSIVDLFPGDFDRNEYLPKQAKWAAWFDWLVEKITDGHGMRVRTYWYVVEHIDFYPFMPFPRESPKREILLKKHQPYRSQLQGLSGQVKEDKMAELFEELRRKTESMRRRFDGWRRIQDGIAGRHNAVEFRRAGAIRYDLFAGNFGQEKAVDVKLATDMIVLQDIYDTAIVVSGDQDYVPAVQVTKDAGKRLVNVSFKTRDGRLLPGGARRLNHITDRPFQVDHTDMGFYLNIGAQTVR